MIELKDLQVHFPVRQSLGGVILGQKPRVVHAVDHIDLSIGSGEIVALVGESGCGKTTLGRSIVRLVKPTGGKVFLDGNDVTRLRGKALKDYHRRIQIIFQDPYESLNPKQTILQIVSEPLQVQGMTQNKEARISRVKQALEDAGLDPADRYLDRFPHELSGGQRQRIAIAAAMVLDPDLVVADEPVSMLDVSIRAGIIRTMLNLREKRHLSFLFITHGMALAWAIADRIAVMYLGKIMEIGPPDDVVRYPQNPYTQALIDVLPSRAKRSEQRRMLLKGETPDATLLPEGCRFNPRCLRVFDRCYTAESDLIAINDQDASACWLAEAGTGDRASASGAEPKGENSQAPIPQER